MNAFHPLHDVALPALARSLACCRRLLARAASHGHDPQSLLATRLAPDMFCLAHQVRILADGVDGACALLAGDRDAPAASRVFNLGDEAWLGIADTRVEQSLARLSVAEARLAALAPDTPLVGLRDAIVVARPGHARHFVAADFVFRYVLPNAGFHVSMVYALLRAAGVPVGKGDFEGPPAYVLVEERLQ